MFSFNRRWLGSDEAGLAIIGALSATRGVSYVPPFVNPDRSATHWLEALLPIQAWAVVWLGLAVMCVAAIVWRRMVVPAVGAVVALHTLWALSFIMGTLAADKPRAWVSALGYVGIAALAAWGFGRGRAGEFRLREE